MNDKMHAPIDRRISRTRGLLQHAFIALIMRKGYDATTIQDICEEANVGRSTFYSHYTSKEDLKRKGLEHIRSALQARQKDALGGSQKEVTVPFSFSLIMFEHARDHLQLCRALLGSDGASISLGSIRQIIADLVRTEVLAVTTKGSGQVDIGELKVHFIVGAFMGILTAWMDTGAIQSPIDVDSLFRTMITEGALMR
ncbi:TetR/AcrR family transcriptional regulator [Asticcacaulis sp. EMRT-3]|uniref:TetR/AcrR family transcriptional regulator n=1 Tax=Asticcacaulis sp. EMRT-3 TaxID=3040349 RepID=UPI0024AF8BE3|nr:TetR/AcrR family transcriptional regulator [Asticcacaulis sp. EMRT-3]MDI7776543.1 TetR/AcrR family transcriptional regulator [Asticcacaulis sp. EMRT-3]